MNVSPHFFGSEIQVFDLTVGQNIPDLGFRSKP